MQFLNNDFLKDLPITLHPNKFGFYKVDGIQTYRKLEALEIYSRTGSFPTWDFNSKTFNAIDWFAEPSCDLWTLYKQRAVQIRNNYDYCVLFYSGGSDSDNILRAWISAGCKIDEIASINIKSAKLNTTDFDWAVEIDQVVEPTIKFLQQHYKFKYREIDSVSQTVDFLKHNISDYFYQQNCSFSPNSVMKSMFRDNIADYINLIASGKKLCFVWGSDKPQIHYDVTNNHWFYNFIDIIDNCVQPYVQEKYHQGWFDELFYWTPDFPSIPVKQSHILKKFCESNNDTIFYQTLPTPYGYNKKLKAYLTEFAVKTIIYPEWNPYTIVAKKPGIGKVRPDFGPMIFSERDQWLFNSNTNFAKSYSDQTSSFLTFLETHNRYNWRSTGFGAVVSSKQSHRFA
jgi:hypothetical protein